MFKFIVIVISGTDIGNTEPVVGMADLVIWYDLRHVIMYTVDGL